MQQGLEGPLDLCPLTRSVLWMGQTHKHMHTLQTHNRAKSYQSTCRYFQLFLMVERAEGLVSVMCFPQRAFGYHTDNSCCFFFRYPSCSSSKPSSCLFLSASPIFSLSFGSVVNAVLFCFQPPHLCILLPLPTHKHSLTCLLHG